MFRVHLYYYYLLLYYQLIYIIVLTSTWTQSDCQACAGVAHLQHTIFKALLWLRKIDFLSQLQIAVA